MPIDYTNQNDLKHLIDEMGNEENVQRKADSFKEYEIYSDRIWRYVYTYLQGQFDQDTVEATPIVASLNISKRIVDQKATLYQTPPERIWSEDLSEQQVEVMEEIYADGAYNTSFNRSNHYFKLQQNQNICQIKPAHGKIKMMPLLRHHLDVIPDRQYPQVAEAYVINGFDRTRFIGGYTDNFSATGRHGPENKYFDDLKNQKIADRDDWKRKARFEWWTKEFHFVTDGYGNILPNEDGQFEIESPIPGVLPFVDFSYAKDFEFWIRSGQSATDFTVEYNAYWSTIMDVIQMQGFSVPVFKGPDDLLPEFIKIGPKKAIRLPVDPNNPVETDFSFVSPSPDIGGSLTAGEQLLSMFMSTQGVDPKTVSGQDESNKFTSGFERMLAMVEKFEASKDDMDVYRRGESETAKVVASWHNALLGTDQLDDKYKSTEIPLDENLLQVKYHRPENIQTESEILDSIERRLDLGILDEIGAYAEYYEVDRDTAEAKLLERQTQDGDI